MHFDREILLLLVVLKNYINNNLGVENTSLIINWQVVKVIFNCIIQLLSEGGMEKFQIPCQFINIFFVSIKRNGLIPLIHSVQ